MILSETVLIIMLVAAWVLGIKAHNKTNQPGKDLIKLPKAISIFFGSLNQFGYVDYKSVFFQAELLIMGILISLYNLELINKQQFHNFVSPIVIVSAIIAVTISLIKDREKD